MDAQWNLVNTVSHTVGLSSSDATATLPPATALAAGTTFVAALVETGLVDSKRAARRALDEGGVRCDGDVVAADGALPEAVHVLQFGRRKWARITVS